MKTNQEKLVMHALSGKIHHPTNKGYRVGYDGIGRILPAVGGITYNFKIGDSCMGLVGDHVEPGVSLQNPKNDENRSLQLFSCIGNVAKVTSGDAKGKLGFVTGTHGGIDHVFIYFDQETLEQLNIDDSILIKGYGQGLQLLDYPNIKVMNLDPKLLETDLIHSESDKIRVGVTHIIPACLMGSGLGSDTLEDGDYDIMTQDKEMNDKYHLETLRFGDIVAIQDHITYNGPHYQKGSWTIGVIVHSDSYTAGHGPGVCAILTASDNSIEPFIDKNANLIKYIK